MSFSKKQIASAGFTLIELMAVCGIMAVMAGIILANQGKFGGQVLLQNFAYDVALSVRQAQVYGISVQRFSNGKFNAGYGVYIDRSVSTTNYVLFGDNDTTTPGGLPDGLYKEGLDDATQRISVTRGYFISKLCVPAGSDASCTGGTEVSQVDIVFVRPEPDALIGWRDNDVAKTLHQCLPSRAAANCGSSARIVMQSPRGDTMSVLVYNNGQITVDQTVGNAN